MLEFQHIIEVTAPADRRVAHMTRQQLWEGLVFRTRYPAQFNSAITCRLGETTREGFVRFLDLGGTELRDEVMLIDQQEIRTSTGTSQSLFAESITKIEEPEAGHLFVRFSYRRDAVEIESGIDVNEYLKTAYVQSDREAIERIRRFVEDGLPSPGTWRQ